MVEHFRVDTLLRDGDRVTGVQGQTRDGEGCSVTAEMVVGADGKHSLLARTVGAPTYHERPAQSAACYTYWQGLQASGGEVYGRDRRAVGVWPTNDGLVMTYVGLPAAEFAIVPGGPVCRHARCLR